MIRNKFNVDINVYYTTLKTDLHFQLKYSTPISLILNVVYKFTCSCDMNVTYIDMITQHLSGEQRSIYIQKRIQQYKNTLMFDNYAKVTNILLTIF